MRYESRRQGHEDPSEAAAGRVALVGAALLILIGVVLWVVTGFLDVVSEAQSPDSDPPFADYRAEPPEPRLQQDPSIELREVRRREYRLLNTYGRIEGEEGAGRMPIDRAMQLLVERGLPVDTTHGGSDTLRIITGTGFGLYTPGPPPPTAPAYSSGKPSSN